MRYGDDSYPMYDLPGLRGQCWALSRAGLSPPQQGLQRQGTKRVRERARDRLGARDALVPEAPPRRSCIPQLTRGLEQRHNTH